LNSKYEFNQCKSKQKIQNRKKMEREEERPTRLYLVVQPVEQPSSGLPTKPSPAPKPTQLSAPIQ
jgi:hypothetical protein